MWSSKEIGIQFEKPNGIFAQLAKIRNGGEPIITAKDRRKGREERKRDFSGPLAEEIHNQKVESLDPNEKLDPESQFSNLKAFYQTQMAESSPVSALGFTGDYGYGSPGALSRIMGLYTGGSFADKKSKTKTGTMREACDALEGLQITALSADEAITKLRTEGWHSTASSEQRKEQTTHTHFLSDLRPIAYLLRTKRSKRCRTCRHILSKPESKVQTIRFRIRLVALNYTPSITIKPLQPASTFSLLTPLKPVQFVLTFKNPLFDSVKVTLATPAKTPGRFPTKVTVLCPQFEVGANTDVWDEALRDNNTRSSLSGEKRRTKAEASEGQHQAEAGKVWERGRNWVSVVVEVVPPILRIESSEWLRSEELKADGGEVREGEDVVEIPVFVRVEWEGEVGGEEGSGLGGGGKEKEVREKRELAYWCVLGLGKVAMH
jgi:dynactin-4